MLSNFSKWNALIEFNKIVNEKTAKYIILIPTSNQFLLLEDLQLLFKRKYQMFQFIQLFKRLECYLVYFTVFTRKQRRLMGPIAEETSSKICTILLNKLLKKMNPNIQIVGPPYLKQKFKLITFEQFILL